MQPPRRKHLLVVDDEAIILEILRAVFEDEPYRLTTVMSGREALDVLADGGVDIVITDKNLPDVSGLEVLRRRRSATR